MWYAVILLGQLFAAVASQHLLANKLEAYLRGYECHNDCNNGFTCKVCSPSFAGNGQKCAPGNGCARNPCFNGVHCLNSPSPPYYRCGECPVGMTGDGKNCKDINECELLHPCDGRVNCINYEPGYVCGPCPAGFTGSVEAGVGLAYACAHKQHCYDIDECADGNNGGCVPHSLCINTEGSFRCGQCLSGYLGDQRTGCFPIPKDFCKDSHECDKNADCVTNTKLGYCKCKVGYAGNGKLCGPDKDLDGWPDNNLNCSDNYCKKDNCVTISNSGQEDADGDGVGDVCDDDADNDGIKNKVDNCPFHYNPEQTDTDSDKVGDKCDNCPEKQNNQKDADGDGIGDECDPDMDNDGIPNEKDNCPKNKNPDQLDKDGDGVGNVCDNCPDVANTNQADEDNDFVGDACDTNTDKDRDGIQDNMDNCPTVPNSDQLDTDGDGVGNACSEDSDGDGVLNNVDNCRLVNNPGQEDFNGDGIGDACQYDYDGDKVPDHLDNCPQNSKISKTDFRDFQLVNLLPDVKVQDPPEWVILNNGSEILETKNSDPSLAVGFDVFGGVDYEGTFFVSNSTDDDFAGFVFSYQNNRKFYVVAWKKGYQESMKPNPFKAFGEPGITIKLVNSASGPGMMLYNALWHTGDTPQEVKLLWQDPRKIGWKIDTAYRWRLSHRPESGFIHLRLYEGTELIADSGVIKDDTLKGGRLGVYEFSQDMITWSDLVYRCNETALDSSLPAKRRMRTRLYYPENIM